jgi:hypothetical protein
VAKSRKTVDVDMLRQYSNGYLAAADESVGLYDGRSRRQGICDLLEFALMRAGRYRGFRYLDERDLPNDIPGIRLKDGDMPSFINVDQTRREYY